MLGNTKAGLLATALEHLRDVMTQTKHGLAIIETFADVVTGAQRARTDAAIARILEGTDPRWVQFYQLNTADPLPRGRAWCRDCGEAVDNHPKGITAFCDQCTEERRASWL